ncbi:MAG TPA: 3-hydroxyisobutyryl-CoA hydrolase [Alphaproteobacteria bacterium]|nr:MAG: 3-hydroxyisobutyryl-CoA hydrolase [SAR116 cluster bacterium MED-G06]HCV88365.1 3-hydroxyisobutyryl-CoA hydrolase [Alphaproteobacteria bacterium]|tara:strand:+ start:2080 stop:3135 length:1056 start_codon:yes stop_codon:yes gene_type:complete
MQQDDIHFTTHASAGLVLMDRPRALNALSFEMASAIVAQLSAWAEDDSIGHVVLAGSEARAFCAGGDIRDLYRMAGEGDHDGMAVCFRAEYMAHMVIAEFPKPVISLADGIVMGGGAGLMQAGSHALVTDKTRFAMPESAIGLFPDAGASVFLGRCPRPLALCLGMTGRIIGAADCLMLGLAHAVVPSDVMTRLRDELLRCDSSEIDEVIDLYRADPGIAPLQAHRTEIDHIFTGDDPISMRDRAGDMARLKGSSLAAEIHEALSTRCPMTMHVFRRLLDMADEIADIPAALMLDYHLALRMTRRDDFREGVRAVLVDKTNDAAWTPARLEDVEASMVDAIFDRNGLPSLR